MSRANEMRGREQEAGLVERLAAKWAAHFEHVRIDQIEAGLFESDARFMLLAIAEELEAREARLRERYEWPADPISWLRNQAGAESSE